MNKIKELEQKVKELQGEINKLKSSEDLMKKWKPKLDDTYYFMHSYGVVGRNTWTGKSIDKWRYNNLKLFKTQEECERYKKFIEDVNKHKWEFTEEEWGNDNSKYFIFYDSDVLDTCRDVHEKSIGCIYFKTEEDAQYIIDNYEEEILKGWL